jgi:outer membrane protein assembly factor BamB/ABC-type phosphate/phosphonate transport system substrate-binding protein
VSWRRTLACCFAAAASIAVPLSAADLTVAVMDPLAAPLSCHCVKGYGQRDYEKLGAFLEKRLARRTHVVFTEDLAKAVKLLPSNHLDLVIGKTSVVRSDAAECRLKVRPLAMLTGKEGGTTIQGWFMAPQGDPARKIGDLKGYTILFGPADCAENHAAAIAALEKAGIAVPKQLEIRGGSSDSALDVLENKKPQRMAGLISSYALPLLEGCGTVPKDSLRVVGKTGEVPFITVFATAAVNAAAEKQIAAALAAVKDEPSLLTALESKSGFTLPGGPKEKDSTSGMNPDWPGWRGPQRNGRVAWLPEKLSGPPNVIWRMPLTGAGLSGVVATSDVVIVADRDAPDQDDIFRCLSAADGSLRWKLQYPAPGKLDYGNAPRATPLIHEGRVYLLGALGDLHCVSLADGSVLWKKNLVREFNAELVRWGMSSSPLIVEGRLIVNPGGKKATLAALDPLDGKLLWQSPGKPSAYASFIAGRFGGVTQIVGYDSISLGGWDPATGRRLWFLFPPERGDFNVPSPVDVDGRLLAATENNHARLYAFDASSKILPKPLARNEDLSPDSSTPVAVGGRIFGCSGGLYCLDAATLRTLWTAGDDAFHDYASLVSDGRRVLAATTHGELVLVDATGHSYVCLGRLQAFPGRNDVISHPALVGKRIYLRSGNELLCLGL